MADPLHSQILEAHARELFGEGWGEPLARLTGVHGRTLRRIKAAAAEGKDYPGARGVLAALHERLALVVKALEPYRRD